jgi:TonB family protein
MSQATVLAVESIFRGVVIGTRHLWSSEQRGRRSTSSSAFVIGSTADAHGPVASEYVDGPSLALAQCEADDDDCDRGSFVINVTARMAGQIDHSGIATPLAAWIERHGTRFVLPAAARAEIVCGQTTFVIATTTPPDRLPAPAWFQRSGWRWEQQRYTLWSAAALLLLVLLAKLVPPDPKALSFDRASAQLRFVDFTLVPPEQKAIPLPQGRGGHRSPGAFRKAAPGPTGMVGDLTARDRHRRMTLPGPPDTHDPKLARRRLDEIKETGILGLLRPEVGSQLASILGRDSAIGNDSESHLGDLIASRPGDAYGTGALGEIGTGAAGADGDGVIGIGRFGTIDSRGHDDAGGERGRGGSASLGVRRAIKLPDYIAGPVAVRGALDKEIVRRIIRNHINEVKYCYELELLRHDDLAGRIAVNFTITPTGQVAAAMVQSSTMNNPRVESCLVGAVRRWEFPKPVGGGLVIATYPFSFRAAGRSSAP